MTYRVVLRARPEGSWDVYMFADKDRLFRVPYRKQSAAEFFAAKLVDELLQNGHEFSCDVQDEAGRSARQINLLMLGRRLKVRGK